MVIIGWGVGQKLDLTSPQAQKLRERVLARW